MDVLDMYLLQRVSDELVNPRYNSFEKRFVSQIPDDAAAKAAHEGYVTFSKEFPSHIRLSDKV